MNNLLVFLIETFAFISAKEKKNIFQFDEEKIGWKKQDKTHLQHTCLLISLFLYVKTYSSIMIVYYYYNSRIGDLPVLQTRRSNTSNRSYFTWVQVSKSCSLRSHVSLFKKSRSLILALSVTKIGHSNSISFLEWVCLFQ